MQGCVCVCVHLQMHVCVSRASTYITSPIYLEGRAENDRVLGVEGLHWCIMPESGHFCDFCLLEISWDSRKIPATSWRLAVWDEQMHLIEIIAQFCTSEVRWTGSHVFMEQAWAGNKSHFVLRSKPNFWGLVPGRRPEDHSPSLCCSLHCHMRVDHHFAISPKSQICTRYM